MPYRRQLPRADLSPVHVCSRWVAQGGSEMFRIFANRVIAVRSVHPLTGYAYQKQLEIKTLFYIAFICAA